MKLPMKLAAVFLTGAVLCATAQLLRISQRKRKVEPSKRENNKQLKEAPSGQATPHLCYELDELFLRISTNPLTRHDH